MTKVDHCGLSDGYGPQVSLELVAVLGFFKTVSTRIKKVRSHINMTLLELKDFSNETSIHGPSQIGNDESSIVKRLLWLGIFLGCLAYGARELTISISGT